MKYCIILRLPDHRVIGRMSVSVLCSGHHLSYLRPVSTRAGDIRWFGSKARAQEVAVDGEEVLSEDEYELMVMEDQLR